MKTHDDSLQIMTTQCSGVLFQLLRLHATFTFTIVVFPAFARLFAFACLTIVLPAFACTLKT
jgi:hypothetical protein